MTTCKVVSEKPLILNKIDLEQNIKIDTITRYYNDSLLLVNINIYGALGDFTTHCGYIRKFGSESIIYKAIDFTPFRVSSDYIAQISSDYYGKTNWGWFAIDSNAVIRSLPQEKEILDSIKSGYLSDYFVTTNSYGFFSVYKNGKIVAQYNYGNIILNDTAINFNELSYGLYKITNNHLVTVSDNPDVLLKEGAGIYFVSQPGLGVKRKYKKTFINNTLMSYSTLLDYPNEIKINASK